MNAKENESGINPKNSKEEKLGINVKKEGDFSEWYNQVVLKAELADYAPVHGFMVIRPNGFILWQKIQEYFNQVLAENNVRNAYFPLLIPESFFKREAEHAEGFSPELAWIEKSKDESDERVAIRPTSETIMYDSYSKWIRSYRELPLRINQWANVVRWEIKQTKLFLRTREFLWQEGHCVYETEEECEKEALLFLNEYKKLCENLLAIPVLCGKKTEKEKFAGAKATYTVEALMPDGKALQMGTSHNLGQNFAKCFDVSFLGKDMQKHLAWQNSWGFSTRLIGALVMVHSDNKGLVLPPKMALNKIVIVPIAFEKEKKALEKAKELQKTLKEFNPLLDDRTEYSPGWKFNEWELKGIPIRLEIGPKDLEKKQVVLARRDTGEKFFVKEKDAKDEIEKLLEKIRKNLFEKAKKAMEENIVECKNFDELKKAIDSRKMVLASFCGSVECEEKINETTATTRCIPPGQEKSGGKCIACGKACTQKAYFAKSY